MLHYTRFIIAINGRMLGSRSWREVLCFFFARGGRSREQSAADEACRKIILQIFFTDYANNDLSASIAFFLNVDCDLYNKTV